MAKAVGGLPGFRDFYPDEFAARAFIQQAWRDVARRFGFVEYDGPPLEPLELYTKKSGDEIVGQLYNFTDKGEREVALRPEMTPTFARMVGARANAMRKPIRWFSIPQLFRYERQQKGRLREHFQLNVDIVGEPDATADAELLAVAIECMRAFGLTSEDVVARVSDKRLLAALLTVLGFEADTHVEVMQVIDKLDRQPKDVSREKLQRIGAGGTAVDTVMSLPESGIDLFEKFLRGKGRYEATLEDFKNYLALFEPLGVREFVRFDPSIVRGLAYYTGIVFELFDAKGEFRAICGGGRYDNLLGALSGTDLPALGFGMGDVVLGELLKARGKLPANAITLDYWVAYEDSAHMAEAMRVATQLRRAGHSVEYGFKPVQLGKQLDTARKAGARAVVIVKADRTLRIKDFGSGTEGPFTLPNG
jgi:histidyl-tRNA synthetase